MFCSKHGHKIKWQTLGSVQLFGIQPGNSVRKTTQKRPEINSEPDLHLLCWPLALHACTHTHTHIYTHARPCTHAHTHALSLCVSSPPPPHHTVCILTLCWSLCRLASRPEGELDVSGSASISCTSCHPLHAPRAAQVRQTHVCAQR